VTFNKEEENLMVKDFFLENNKHLFIRRKCPNVCKLKCCKIFEEDYPDCLLNKSGEPMSVSEINNEPGDILWENIGVSDNQRRKWHVITVVAILGFLSVTVIVTK